MGKWRQFEGQSIILKYGSAHEAIKALVEHKADLSIENFEKKVRRGNDCCGSTWPFRSQSVVDMATTNLSKDVDDETREVFFSACKVSDAREFKLRE